MVPHLLCRPHRLPQLADGNRKVSPAGSPLPCGKTQLSQNLACPPISQSRMNRISTPPYPLCPLDQPDQQEQHDGAHHGDHESAQQTVGS